MKNDVCIIELSKRIFYLKYHLISYFLLIFLSATIYYCFPNKVENEAMIKVGRLKV